MSIGHSGSWLFDKPKASDYEAMAEFFFGKSRNYTVFYDGVAMCGRCFPDNRRIGFIERIYMHIWHWIHIKRLNLQSQRNRSRK